MGKTYSVAQFKAAIPGSGSIISTIAKRVGCDWYTAKRHIDASATLSRMYKDERESILDMAESVLFKNIENGDSADSKWILSKLGKDRGYGDSVDLKHSERAALTLSGDQLVAAMRQAQAEADEMQKAVLEAGWETDEDTV